MTAAVDQVAAPPLQRGAAFASELTHALSVERRRLVLARMVGDDVQEQLSAGRIDDLHELAARNDVDLPRLG
jgi:hypothetical protein